MRVKLNLIGGRIAGEMLYQDCVQMHRSNEWAIIMQFVIVNYNQERGKVQSFKCQNALYSFSLFEFSMHSQSDKCSLEKRNILNIIHYIRDF